ncbi:hypothetical protein GTP56_17435 [Duganella sp. FT134W]|uniref:Uncharacterized protein n=1 Tax=Duganella margarita TaxID=2692170 RepID=A0A7X4H3J7_9BURK|nr:hypothetical protein [Duganella margarita]MYM73969.1 hypothetical protein [Duganella margarita]
MRTLHVQWLGAFAEIGRRTWMVLALRILSWPFNVAVRMGARIITACIKLTLAVLGMVVFGGFIFGVGYVIFYPMFSH